MSKNINSRVVFDILQSYGELTNDAIVQALNLSSPYALNRLRGTSDPEKLSTQWPISRTGKKRGWQAPDEADRYILSLGRNNEIREDYGKSWFKESFDETLISFFDACFGFYRNGSIEEVRTLIKEKLTEHGVDGSYIERLMTIDKHEDLIREIVRTAANNANYMRTFGGTHPSTDKNDSKKTITKHCAIETPQEDFEESHDSVMHQVASTEQTSTLTLRTIKNLLINRLMKRNMDDETFLSSIFAKPYFRSVYSNVEDAMTGALSFEQRLKIFDRYFQNEGMLTDVLAENVQRVTKCFSQQDIRHLAADIISKCSDEYQDWLKKSYQMITMSKGISYGLSFLLIVGIVTPEAAYRYQN